MAVTFCSLAVASRQGWPAAPPCERSPIVPAQPLSIRYFGMGSQSFSCSNAAKITGTFQRPEGRGRHRLLTRRRAQDEVQRYNSATCALVLLNIAVFLFERCNGIPLRGWWLQHDRRYFHPFQVVTSLFCHRDYRHLSGNLFGLYVFGRAAEEEAGSFGLLTAYLVCGIVANLTSFVLQSGRMVSLGASGAVFGLFVLATFLKLGPDPRCLIEFFVFGQFAFMQLSAELAGPYRPGVDSTAHIAGALGGLIAFWLVRRRGPGRRSGFLWPRRKK